jgi:uncharacterized membrane protein YphA (DoxX/SURF4 family)
MVLTTNSAQSRLYYLRLTIVIAYLAGIALSHKLWIGASRTFPTVPLIEGLAIVTPSAEYLLSPLLIISLVLSAISSRPHRYLIAAAVLTVFLIVLDQSRLQPWVYQYLIMLSVLGWYSGYHPDSAAPDYGLAVNQLVIAALYFWSGIQKLNWTFCHEVAPSLLEPHFGRLAYLPAIGIGIAICEALVGIGLLVRKTRPVAVLAAISIHSLILILLISKGQNSIVWPWNIGMIFVVPLLFRRTEVKVWKRLLRLSESNSMSHFAKVVLVLCGVLPGFSFIGLWDRYLSAALYSGNTSVAVVHLSDRVRGQLHPQVRSHLFTTKDGELMLPFYEWSMAELNVPPYPEARIYEALTRRLCRYAEDSREVELIVKESPAVFTGSYTVHRIDCLNPKAGFK